MAGLANTYLYARVTQADRQRLAKCVAEDGLSLNSWLCGLIDDDLEDRGEPPLTPVLVLGRGRPKRSSVSDR